MIEIRTATGSSDWAQARALLLDYVAWLREAVGVEPLEVQPSFALELDDLVGTYIDPDTTFIVGADADRVVGTMATGRGRTVDVSGVIVMERRAVPLQAVG